MDLHYIRTKDQAEVDFSLIESGQILQLIECKLSDSKVHAALERFAEEHPKAKAIQLVRNLRHEIHHPQLTVEPAAPWLGRLI